MRTLWRNAALVAVFVSLVYALFVSWPLLTGSLTIQSVPVETLYIERIELQPDTVLITVQNVGPTEVTIAQVFIGQPTPAFTAVPPQPPLSRLARTTIPVPYDWVEDEPVEVLIVTSTGITFEKSVEIARETPSVSTDTLSLLLVMAVYIGLVPVALGAATLPFLQGRRNLLNLMLGVTMGLLAFLAVDTFQESIEVSGRLPGPLKGSALIFISAAATFLLIDYVGRGYTGTTNGKIADTTRLGYFIAVGIGFHNLAEGLAVGGAFALAEVTLGFGLALGFALHNITEGVAIVAPSTEAKTELRHLVYMVAIAGAPVIPGIVVGAFAFLDITGLILLGVGLGAILQVIVAVYRFLAGKPGRLTQRETVFGFLLGFIIMYVTGLVQLLLAT